jgi:hypothetical protein
MGDEDARPTDYDEIGAYWDRYYALSLREKIREGGFVHWTTSTNAGVLALLATVALATVVVAVVPWKALWRHEAVQVAAGAVMLIAVVVAVIVSAVRTIRGD